jgi:hypothetical protein
MVLNESHHTRQFAQALRQHDQTEQCHRADRQRPQRIKPAIADPDAGKTPCCGGIQ